MDEVDRRRATWDDYRSWTDDQRWELIDGHPYLMSAPSTLHQELVGTFYIGMAACLRRRPCRVYLSPIDVRLSDWDVVQPDLVVVCERAQILKTHLDGPPAVVVEVLSPSTARHDRIRKMRLYARMGVREYWIVTPMPPTLEVLVLDGDEYRVAGVYTNEGRFRSPSVPDLDLDLEEVFEPSDTSELEEVREGTPSYVTRN